MTMIDFLPLGPDVEVRVFSFCDRHGQRIYRAEALEDGYVVDCAEAARRHDLDDFVDEMSTVARYQ